MARTIPAIKMTAECWLVQWSGLSICDSCQFVDSDECGGEEIRETGKNSRGFEVPLGEAIK